MSVDIWFGQFNIADGETTEEGPYVGIFEGTRSAGGVGLYAVAEPVGGATPVLCNEVLDALAASFGHPEAALTANLLRAVAAAHQCVREWNRLHGTERMAGVGLSCIATRGNEAYLAQCGSALALAQTGGRFRVSSPAGDDSRRPLGLGERAAPIFTRLTLNPGDTVILSFSAADQIIDRGTLASLVTAPPEEAMPALYVRVRAQRNFGALYLTALPPAPQPLLPREDEPVSSYASAPVAGYQDFDEEDVWHAPVRERRTRATVSPSPRRDRRNGHEAEHGNVFATEVSARARAARQIAFGALGQRPRLPSRGVIIGVALVLAVALVLWLAIPALAKRGNDDRYQELLRSADEVVASVQAEPDPAKRRQLLARAEADLLEARGIQPENGDVADRLSTVSTLLSSLDGTRELADLAQIADLGLLGIAPQSPIELAVAGRIYLLDAGSGRVLAFSGIPNDRPETVFEEGRSAGGDRMGRPRHLAVAPAAPDKPATLLVLDTNRRLFALEAQGWRAVPLAGTEEWKSDTAIAVTSSAFYVLDAAAEQVWRHLGSPAGFDGGADPLVARASLKDGVGLSISGVPIVATSDSRLLRIVEGKDDEMKPSALDRALKSPSPPIFNTADSLLYVADRGNQRIVLLDAAGRFQGQLSSRRFTALRGVALDEARGAIYAVSGQALLKASLPK